jgi:hypothetical protein
MTSWSPFQSWGYWDRVRARSKAPLARPVQKNPCPGICLERFGVDAGDQCRKVVDGAIDIKAEPRTSMYPLPDLGK